jgi:hypothetical protein
MFTSLPGRAVRAAVGLGVAAAFISPGLAQAATDDSTVIVSGAGAVALTTPPTFGNFPGVTLTGANQTVTADVTNWVVTDATGAAPGWSANIVADVPHNGGSTVVMTGAALELLVSTASTEGTNLSTAPVVAGKVNIIGGGGIDAANAAAGTGAGTWTLAQGTAHLKLTVPADATAASYTTTVTTTLNAAV